MPDLFRDQMLKEFRSAGVLMRGASKMCAEMRYRLIQYAREPELGLGQDKALMREILRNNWDKEQAMKRERCDLQKQAKDLGFEPLTDGPQISRDF